MVRAFLAGAALAVAALLASCGGGGGGSSPSRFDVAQSWTIQNAQQTLVFAELVESGGALRHALTIDSIVDRESGVVFALRSSPLWSVELRALGGGAPTVLVPATPDPTIAPTDADHLQPVGPVLADASSLGFSLGVDGRSATLAWSELPISGSAQRLAVTVEVALRDDAVAGDFRCTWNVEAHVSGAGPYGVYAIRFPYLASGPIGATGTDDVMLLPYALGMTMRDPIAFDAARRNHRPERDGPPCRTPDGEGTLDDALFTYPGFTFSQFLATYDPTAGLYLQAEDPDGLTKNLYFAVGRSTIGEGRRCYFHLTHFAAIDPNAPAASLAAFRVPYACASQVFHGDWLDAARIYRDWARTAASATLLQRGSLLARTDFDAAQKTTAWIVRYQLPPSPIAIDPAAEAAKLARIFRFYDAVRVHFDPARALDFRPFVLAALYQDDGVAPRGPLEYPDGDVRLLPLRPGVPEWLARIRAPSDPNALVPIAVSTNRDSTGFEIPDGTPTGAPTDPFESRDPCGAPGGAATTFGDALRKGVAGTWCLDRMSVLRSTNLAPRTRYRTCIGSEWLRCRRTAYALATMEASRVAGGPVGFDAVALTGTGNVAYECYAPLSSDVDPAAHRHLAGGGDAWTAGWHDLAEQLRRAAADASGPNVPHLVIGTEHAPETLVRDCFVDGRSFVPPYDLTTTGSFTTLLGAEPVPLFEIVYHDFALWQAAVPPFFAVAEDFASSRPADPRQPLPPFYVRYRAAQLAMLGRVLRVQFSQDEALPWEGVPDAADTSPPNCPAYLLDTHRFLAALAVLRAELPGLLVFGAALRDPVVTPAPDAHDLVSIQFRQQFGVGSIVESVPKVIASAWTNGDGGPAFPAIVLVNFHSVAASVTFSFAPRDYGLAPGVRYRVERRAAGVATAWTDAGWPTFDGSDATFTSPPISIPSLEQSLATPTGEPWAVFRLVLG